MAESLTVEQRLAAELGLPEAQGAPADSRFSVARLLEWQEVVMERKRARRAARAKSAFLPPVPVPLGVHSFGLLRKD